MFIENKETVNEHAPPPLTKKKKLRLMVSQCVPLVRVTYNKAYHDLQLGMLYHCEYHEVTNDKLKL